MITPRSALSLTRRAAVSSLSLAGLGAALAAIPGHAATQDATPYLPPGGGPTATINGADLYYEVRGDTASPAVLLLHGGLATRCPHLELWYIVPSEDDSALALRVGGPMPVLQSYGRTPCPPNRLGATRD